VNAAASLLAGGAGRRIGRPKALLDAGSGESFLLRLTRRFAEAGCDPVIAVLGHQADAVRAAHPLLPARIAINPDPDRGQLSSLQTGLGTVPPDSPVLFHPVDTPLVSAASIRLVRETPGELVIPRHQALRGHPVKIGPRLIAALLALPPEAQAREVIRAHYHEAVYVDVDDPGVCADIDTPEDYAQWFRSSPR
jgi:CTP:molybdopterin cytidylyltransferase MocA